MERLLSAAPFGSETMGLRTSWVIFQNGERAGEDKTWPWNKESLATGTHARYPPPPEAMLLTGAPAPPPSDHTAHSFHVFEALALCQGPCQCREAGEQPSLEALAASAPSPPHRPRALRAEPARVIQTAGKGEAIRGPEKSTQPN